MKIWKTEIWHQIFRKNHDDHRKFWKLTRNTGKLANTDCSMKHPILLEAYKHAEQPSRNKAAGHCEIVGIIETTA